MRKKKPMVGDMLFEKFNNLSYQEQCGYISTLKTNINDDEETQSDLCVEIDCTIEEFIQKYNLISLNDLIVNITDIEDKSNNMHD
jgi:hypothetical protein